ncbi:MAG: radical SAM protein [Candidatus Aminicenantes bacterium]|jgi:DNA repair photolyase
MLAVRETQAKSILNTSKVFDYCVNVYTGCQHDCKYCYARLFMRRYSGHTEPWGEFVDVKINAPELLRKQLQKAKRGAVWVSSVCDPYQPLEARYNLTRQCLEELLKVQFPVNIQTKSKLVVRDLDLFLRFEEMAVTMTIATDREDMARLFETRASSVKDRLEALKQLHSAGIHTAVFIGPILPGNPEKLVAKLDGTVDRVLIDKMNYMSTIRGFYKKHNLEYATTMRYFYDYKTRLLKELQKRGIPTEGIF